MKSTITTSLLALVAAGAIACGGGRTDRNTATTGNENNAPAVGTTGTTGRSDTSMGENRFIKNAAEDGMAEVEAARLAEQKSASADVKAFARMLIRDHEQADKQLKEIAARHNAEIPATLSGDHKDMVDDLAKLQGADFDREYANRMVDDHKKAVDMFSDQSKKADRPELKEFAANTLPTLEKHLQEAQQLQAKFEHRPREGKSTRPY